MEVLGSTLFAIQSNVIRAYDVVTGDQIGPWSPRVSLFQRDGKRKQRRGDVLVVSDFSAGRLLKVDVSDPANMVATTLSPTQARRPMASPCKTGWPRW